MIPTGPGAPKIAVIDIETFPNLVFTWGLWKQNVAVNQIVRDWSLASVCWKWLGERQTHYVDCSDDPSDDTKVMKAAWEVLDKADIVVGQNSKHFDIRKLNARFIEKGWAPPSPYKQIDTKVEASKIAMFTSNRLEWLSVHLTDTPKDKHKDFPGFELWVECMKGNPKAWAAMKKYNPRDVVATEKVYLQLRPWIIGHPNVSVLMDDKEPRCPKCGSNKVQKRGPVTTQSGLYTRYQCKVCHGWGRSRYTENHISQRRALLAN